LFDYALFELFYSYIVSSFDYAQDNLFRNTSHNILY